MAQPCMIIGTKLALHREVLAGALATLRPHIAVHAVEPGEVDDWACCSEPRLVIAADRALIDRLAPHAWILLYPDDTDLAIASVGGDVRPIPRATMEDLLGVVDAAWT